MDAGVGAGKRTGATAMQSTQLATLDVDELRTRPRKMSDEELLEIR